MNKLVIAAMCLIGLAIFAGHLSAQPVGRLVTNNISSTIASTNVFQSVQAAAVGRSGCTIQNQSTANSMWVFFGPIASATKATSIILDSTHGLTVSCAVPFEGVLTDQVSITGTSGDAFSANFQ